MKTPKWVMVAVVLFMALSMLLMVVPAGANPADYPCNFYGTATVDGSPVGAGTEITAWLGVSQVASTNTGVGSLADYEYAFSVILDEANEGATINFKIGALEAIETGIWQKLQFVEVNLTATTPTPNNPPNVPGNPSPADDATGVSIDANLSWTGGDPDAGDTVTYDVYFEKGDNTPDQLVSNDQTGTTYDPGTLSYDTQYYWQIVARDNHGASTEGPIWDFTTMEDIFPPTVESTLPVNGATGVAVGTSVTATFSEDIQEGANFAGIIISGATGVSATIVGDTLTIAHDVFAYKTLYEVTIPAGAVNDLVDNPLAEAYTWSFTTGSPSGEPWEPLRDKTRPRVTRTWPANGASGVAVDTLVTATFSELVRQATIVFTLDSVSGSVSFAGTTATFDPTANLAYSTTYTASIRASDLAGNFMIPATYTWSFITEAAPVGEASVEEPEEPASNPHNASIENPSGPSVVEELEVVSISDEGLGTGDVIAIVVIGIIVIAGIAVAFVFTRRSA